MDFTELNKLRIDNPELTYDNEGYDNISSEVRDRNADAIAKIEGILKDEVEGFSKFQNFKPRKDGSYAIRMQAHYDASFVGVHYLEMEEVI